MRAFRALIRKEIRECRWHLLGGLLIFIAAPAVITGWVDAESGQVDTDFASGTVLFLGGAFAALLGVHAGTCDLSGGVDSFLRSRPIRLSAWTASKYLVWGSAALLVTSLPVVLEIVWVQAAIEGGVHVYVLRERFNILLGHGFSVLLIYSAAFFLGSLLREPVKAMLLALAAGLLVYFLPVLVPGLAALSFYNLLDDWRDRYYEPYGAFVLAHLGLTAAAGLLAWAAVRRGARVELSQRELVAALGGVAVGLLVLTAEQMGSNLAAKAVYTSLPRDRDLTVGSIDIAGRRGIFTLTEWPRGVFLEVEPVSVQEFDLGAKPPRFGEPIATGLSIMGYWAKPKWFPIVWSADRPERAYLLSVPVAKPPEARGVAGESDLHELLTLDLNKARASGPVINHLNLSAHLVYFRENVVSVPAMHRIGDTLHIYTGLTENHRKAKVARIDLSDRDAPSFVDVVELDRTPTSRGGGQEMSVDLPAALGLEPRQRLEVMVALDFLPSHAVLEGDLLVLYQTVEGIETWKLELWPDRAVFKLLGKRRPTPLEGLLAPWPSDLFLRDGWLFALSRYGLTVFDLGDPAHARRAGHYAAPGEDFRALAPLPGGEVLLAGRKLHVLAPPARAAGARAGLR